MDRVELQPVASGSLAWVDAVDVIDGELLHVRLKKLTL